MTPGAQALRLLLVTHGDPQSDGVCELFLRDLASHCEPDSLVRYTMVDVPARERESTWLGFRSVTRRVRHSARPVVSTWTHREFSRRSAPEITKEIVTLVRDERIDLIWMILNSPNTICVAEGIVEASVAPLVVTVWDDAEYLASSYHFDPWTTRAMLRSFTSVLQRSRRVAVASDGMAELYASKYNVRGIPLIHGIHPSLWQTPAAAPAAKTRHFVGFAGSLHCKTEWNAFVAAVSDWNRTEASEIRIRFIGRFPGFGARTAPFIEQVGSLSLPDTLKELAATDVAYVPYWFARDRAWAAKTAFPSKLSAYVAAGVPVLYHGPADSSPAVFLRRYPVGLSCHSLEIPEIQRTLRTLLFDQAVRSVASKEQRRALEEQLGAEAMLRRFAQVIGIDRALLLPVATSAGGTQ
jgi:hypothetical protein